MKKTIRDLAREDLEGARVLVRVDFNVPLDGGEVTDSTRIERTLPTLRLLCDAGARVVLLSHLGRPGGERRTEFSLGPVARRLEQMLDAPVTFCPESTGPAAERAVADLGNGHVLLLENTRFHAGETGNDADLARSWADVADVYVNDAFGTAHRAHASTEGVARLVRERGGEAVAGLLMERELRFLGRALADPAHPFVAILGGAKISGKIDVIEAFLPRVDRLIIGGAMANTFFAALGLETGKSLVEEDRIEMARDLMDRGGERIVLPVDCVVAETLDAGALTRVVARDAVGPADRIGDVGPASLDTFTELVGQAETVVWNGPMGVFELEPFAHGTVEVARVAATAAEGGAVVIVGGGDSAAAAESAGVADRLTHVSTGGGASLEFLSGRELPGVAALSDA